MMPPYFRLVDGVVSNPDFSDKHHVIRAAFAVADIDCFKTRQQDGAGPRLDVILFELKILDGC